MQVSRNKAVRHPQERFQVTVTSLAIGEIATAACSTVTATGTQVLYSLFLIYGILMTSCWDSAIPAACGPERVGLL
jgi:hypothetical protein